MCKLPSPDEKPSGKCFGLSGHREKTMQRTLRGYEHYHWLIGLTIRKAKHSVSGRIPQNVCSGTVRTIEMRTKSS